MPRLKSDLAFAGITTVAVLFYALMGIVFLQDFFTLRVESELLLLLMVVFRHNDWLYELTLLLLQLLAAYTFVRTGYEAFRHWRMHAVWVRKLLAARVPYDADALELPEGLEGRDLIVIRSEKLQAYAIGLLRPRIVISTKLLKTFDKKEIEAILLHEYYHCRQFDPLKTLVTTVISSSIGYVPVFKTMIRYYKIWDELLADRYAVERMDTSFALGSVLLKWSKVGKTPTPEYGVMFAPVAMNYRILQLVEPEKRPRIPFFVARGVIMSAGLFGILVILSLDICGL